MDVKEDIAKRRSRVRIAVTYLVSCPRNKCA